ncbi:MAG: NTE family protein [Yoonia sp.]
MKAAGEQAADTFLKDHKADIGKRSSVELAAMFS